MEALLTYLVEPENDGKTVEKILKNVFGISSTLLTYLKKNSRLMCNGDFCRSVYVCRTGDIISADVSENLESYPDNIIPCCRELEVVFEDDFLLAVNKPGKMASHPCPGNYENSLANAVMYYWGISGEYHNYHIVNRLDKDTSGLCLIAKNRFAHGVLSAQMRDKSFERGYTAIVHGVFDPESGTIEEPILRCDDSILKRKVSPDGKYAKTNYNTIENYGNQYSLVDISLETGRTHQIRVHFSCSGHPLIGDWLYGMGDEEKKMISRHALHAGYISFRHPLTREKIVLNCALPADMEKLRIELLKTNGKLIK